MQLTIIQQIILGLIQGITEWLPISSSAFITLIMSNFYNITDISKLIHTSLFLHLGTFFAALIYFRKDIWNLTKNIFNYKYSNKKTKNILKFLFITTLISGIIGIILMFFLDKYKEFFDFTGKSITFFIGVFLLFTAIIQIKINSNSKELKNEKEITNNDSFILGIVQSFSILPGISRSGITISSLLLRKFDDTTALKLSFLMSLPIVLIGNLILNLPDFKFTSTTIYGLLTSFIFGILTISGLMKLSKKINFGWFVLIFAILMIASLLIL